MDERCTDAVSSWVIHILCKEKKRKTNIFYYKYIFK